MDTATQPAAVKRATRRSGMASGTVALCDIAPAADLIPATKPQQGRGVGVACVEILARRPVTGLECFNTVGARECIKGSQSKIIGFRGVITLRDASGANRERFKLRSVHLKDGAGLFGIVAKHGAQGFDAR